MFLSVILVKINKERKHFCFDIMAIKKKITLSKDRTGTPIYPMTVDEAITMSDGRNLREYIDSSAIAINKDDTAGITTFTQGDGTETEFTSEYMFNINAYHKTYTTPYTSKLTARDDVPFKYRKRGLVITYLYANSTNWIVEQYAVPSSTGDMHYTNWTSDTHWKSITSSSSGGSSPTPVIVYPGDLTSVYEALRSLQAEVIKIKNSFNYGLYSYTGTATAMSSVMTDYTEVDEDEPLWSIEEEDLSEIPNASVLFNVNTNLTPLTNITFNSAGTEGVINGMVSWDDRDGFVSGTTDPKIMMFSTTSNKNEIIVLQNKEDETKSVSIDLRSFDLPEEVRYNVLLVVSRTVTDASSNNEIHGKNFVWMSVAGYTTSEILGEGYIGIDGDYICDYTFHKDCQESPCKFTISNVFLSDQTLYKLNFYSKFQDFSHEVIPQKPTDLDYRYKVAHITIRSVADKEELDKVAEYLPKNELIYKENDGTLWIKTSSGVKRISGSESKDTSTGMTETEIIDLLVRMGIIAAKVVIKKDANGNDVKYYSELTVNDICDVTFINEHSGKKFNITVDEDGNIITKELAQDSSTISQMIIDSSTSSVYKMSYEDHVRGLSSRYFGIGSKMDVLVSGSVDSTASDGTMSLNSDRVKIGSYYAPLGTDTVHGCSHAYIELENTSDKDFILDGCYIHWMRPNPVTGEIEVLHHALSGILRGGSTYLIRGKQYADPELDDNVFINVNEYDDEWYIGSAKEGYELLDMSIIKSSNWSKNCYGIALTYGQENLTADTSTNTINTISGFSTSTYPYMWRWWYIDSLAINEQYSSGGNNCTWTPCDVTNVVAANSNTIVKNTFELDPAKQAFQGLNTKDTSRVRGAKYENDIQYVNLSNEYISFPNSDETYPVSRFTPKCSKSKKNVCTDKSKLDMSKPNMVTCSFGIDGFTTRCFNWISAGYYDEYVWLYNETAKTWTRFESYKSVDTAITASDNFPRRKEYDIITNNAVYARMYSFFPADGTQFTSHKCVIDVVEEHVTTPTTYKYRIGRAKLDRTTGGYVIDELHASDEYTFTLYPDTYTPRIYQITDQQGFHWIEYQVWAAAAEKLNEQITAECAKEKIIPVLVNTGDMTQNGTRINEWLDYYNAGRSLFSHLEQMNVVGNNDLCGTTPTVLGSGDDTGKSNAYYFHLFYCYDSFTFTDSDYEDGDERHIVRPLIKGSDNVYRYIPSFYYFDLGDYRFVMVNSEITETNCKDWFKKTIENQLDAGGTKATYTVNVYTGWQVIPNVTLTTDPYSVTKNAAYDESFTTIYTMLYDIFNDSKGKRVIVACHEMPFTVITNGELKTNESDSASMTQCRYRSLNTSNGLIGSHMNQISKSDVVSIYWFSRLLEYFNINLVIGGHKHTYACTYPVKENYIYYENQVNRTSNTNPIYSYDTPMTMKKTLESDNWQCKWFVDRKVSTGDYQINLTKLPLLASRPKGIDASASVVYTDSSVSDYYVSAGSYYPVCASKNYTGDGITYFMCQATGYKLTSNKELPTQKQVFSRLIPKTTVKDGADKPDGSQKFPMFCTIMFGTPTSAGAVDASIYLARIDNIMSSGKFSQSVYKTGKPFLQYAYQTDAQTNNFCSWKNETVSIVTTQLAKL